MDLSNYAIKVDLKRATGIDTFPQASKTNLDSFKTKVDKLDMDCSFRLSKLNNVVGNEVVKKTLYALLWLVFKVSAIDN